MREVINALHFLVRSGVSQRLLPHDFPMWDIVYQQTRRWLVADCFGAEVHDLQALLRMLAEP